ncbi:MAG: hypothetical protein ACFFBE_06555 [Promethearchaeota archaeon]
MVSASNGTQSLEINTEFEMIEYSISEGTYSDINDIILELPSSTWGIDDIEMNFTDVEFGLEVKTIEDNPTDMVTIAKFDDKYGYSVQIVIDDPTIIYSVLIYGNNESTINLPIYVQIHGYDNVTNSPNSTVFGMPILLNMSYSLTPSWHLQTFSNPINLSKGNYYLVIDGTSIGESPKAIYNWYYNNTSPNYPNLHISEYDGTSWTTGVQGTPLLHKFIQKVNSSFFPEEINMTAEFDGTSFQISNGEHPGKGYLKKYNINYQPNNKDIKIKIKNNKTTSLDFNLNYSININNEFLASSLLKIQYNSSNIWSVFPSIERTSNNHTVKFYYPYSWDNIVVSKNQQDITAEIVFDVINKILIIPNETIENGAEWEIQAYSSSIGINLNIIKTEFEGGQDLQFSIGSPILNGIYEFRLIDPLGSVRYQEAITLPTDNNLFSYPIPTNILEGDYIAYVYWYNQTDAGVQSQVFSLFPLITPNLPPEFPIFLILSIALISGLGLVGGVSGYVIIKKAKTRHTDKLRLVLEKCSDVMNLEYVIVLDKKSGIDVYSEAFGEKKVDATLISGFLQAIQNFGSEVLGRAKDSRTFKVEYRKSIIIMAEFVNLRLIVITKESPSKNFFYTVESLAYDIYKDFGDSFDRFDGVLTEFQGIKKLLEKHLNVSILYPLTINHSLKTKLTPEEKHLVQRALTFMQESDFNYFYVLYLLPDNVCTPKDYETILQLIQKGIFTPIDKDSN